jgi:hypothetical protein
VAAAKKGRKKREKTGEKSKKMALRNYWSLVRSGTRRPRGFECFCPGGSLVAISHHSLLSSSPSSNNR